MERAIGTLVSPSPADSEWKTGNEMVPGRHFLYFIGVVMKAFWQHENGQVYAVDSDSFGNIRGVAGPLELDDLRDPGEYHYRRALVPWLVKSITQRSLRRINPAIKR